MKSAPTFEIENKLAWEHQRIDIRRDKEYASRLTCRVKLSRSEWPGYSEYRCLLNKELILPALRLGCRLTCQLKFVQHSFYQSESTYACVEFREASEKPSKILTEEAHRALLPSDDMLLALFQGAVVDLNVENATLCYKTNLVAIATHVAGHLAEEYAKKAEKATRYRSRLAGLQAEYNTVLKDFAAEGADKDLSEVWNLDLPIEVVMPIVTAHIEKFLNLEKGGRGTFFRMHTPNIQISDLPEDLLVPVPKRTEKISTDLDKAVE